MATLSPKSISQNGIKHNLAINQKFILESNVKSLTLMMLLFPLHVMMWTIHTAVISHSCSQHIQQNNPFQIYAKIRTVCFSLFLQFFISWFSLRLALEFNKMNLLFRRLRRLLISGVESLIMFLFP